MAGLDPNKERFDTLPPHFILRNPMKNETIAKGMKTMFGKILVYHEGVPSTLIRYFACVIYHQEDLIKQMCKIPGHAFNKLQILHDRPLLKQLKDLVTIDPTEGVMTIPSGIPPHVYHSRKMKLIWIICLKENACLYQLSLRLLQPSNLLWKTVPSKQGRLHMIG